MKSSLFVVQNPSIPLNCIVMIFRIVFLAAVILSLSSCGEESQKQPPNILFAIWDDVSYPHVSAVGSKMVSTPAFDRIAREGVLFKNAYAPAPGCSPSRAAFLTGRHIWMIEQAGTHASSFPQTYLSYQDLLEEAGYAIGNTGKPWGPGNLEASNRSRNPAGPQFMEKKFEPPFTGIRNTDYAANFEDFYHKKELGQPFSFWVGGHEPHRRFEAGSWEKAGKKLEDAEVPPFLPDTPEIRADLLDYAVEIEWFDTQIGRILDFLEDAGELDNTLVIFTADNGMAFPRAKANLYDYGTHMPLAVRWAGHGKAGRRVEDLVQFVDLTATIIDAAGVNHPGGATALIGRSIRNILDSEHDGMVDESRIRAYSGRERHSSSRWNNLTYPQRSMRTPEYLYIRNFKPQRWPAGAPQKYIGNGQELEAMHGGYHDIDASPSLQRLIEGRNEDGVKQYFQWAVGKRPEEELFDLEKDPGCLNNLAGDATFDSIRAELRTELDTYLTETNDPRATGGGDVWEGYIRYSNIRKFPKPPDADAGY